jgi:hypothetical protein
LKRQINAENPLVPNVKQNISFKTENKVINTFITKTEQNKFWKG